MTRYMGTETEYGITTPDDPSISQLLTSTHAVVAYAAMNTAARSRWSYEEEAPLKDTRGFDLQRYRTVPVVDANAMGVANVVTTNGARYYVDHGHPEYSSPEVSNAWDAMIYDAAGDYVLNKAAADIRELWDQQISVLDKIDPCPPLKFYKNNVDGKGQSYGSHENYQYSRKTDFARLTQALIPFFVTRQVIIGAGRMGIGQESEREGFQISQRADYFEQEVSLETTLNRGIVNTRDEPHALAAKFRRLHVIVGDANMSQYSNFLKMGMTKLVLDCIESDVDFSDLRLANPVDEIKQVSHDPTCTHELLLADGRRLTAIEILRIYRERAAALPELDEVDTKVLALWGEILDDLERDPLSTADRLDWTAKWSLIKRYLDRGVDIADPKLKLIDIQYADIDPAKSLYHALVRKGQMRTLVDEATIERAVTEPPTDSRAYFRGRVSEKFGEDIVASSWQSVIFSVNNQPHRLPMDKVDGFTKEEIGELVERAEDITALLKGLGFKHV
ncbi:depupylase/deamidase Dop [Corynebacterium sp. HMSC071B10]|uniref:depupylase/deamidase Dop n=1 Tax=Corynebacterium sp. HMSC071B10 TaxID=1739494 RepID=UPI0008A10D01|nr:depupylase/deamidase Dop [Corynebacterium sp. HMSC071B10]OFP37277.1 proteasome accessory factor PafA2 [Corynebacterium sp. HMSC071B10]